MRSYFQFVARARLLVSARPCRVNHKDALRRGCLKRSVSAFVVYDLFKRMQLYVVFLGLEHEPFIKTAFGKQRIIEPCVLF